MTHGHIVFLRFDGTQAAEIYAYHDGHSSIAFNELCALPAKLAEREKFRQTLPLEKRHLVNAPWQFGRLFERGAKALNTLPNFECPCASNLANWFCTLHFDTWLFVPADEMSYPGPSIEVRETVAGGGTFLISETAKKSENKPFTLDWKKELLKTIKP